MSGTLHASHKGDVVQRGKQLDVGHPVENFAYGGLYVGVQVNGIHDQDIASSLCNGSNCLADSAKREAKTLSPMSGHQDDAQAIGRAQAVDGEARFLRRRACVSNRASITVFPVTICSPGLLLPGAGCSARLRWERNEIRHVGSEAAVDLFGEGIIFLPGAQAGFDVPNRNVAVVRSERGGKGRSRIALHKHHVWAFPPQDSGPARSGRPQSPRQDFVPPSSPLNRSRAAGRRLVSI